MFRYFVTLVIFVASTSYAAVQWQTNYEQAAKQSKENNKPMILFFTGSDWCGWCTKLEQEALETADFDREAGSQFIFVKLDYPMRNPIDPKTKQQNAQLKDKFQITGYPTLIVLDSNGEKIGHTGYRAGGGKQYASHLNKMVTDYTAYRQKLNK